MKVKQQKGPVLSPYMSQSYSKAQNDMKKENKTYVALLALRSMQC